MSDEKCPECKCCLNSHGWHSATAEALLDAEMDLRECLKRQLAQKDERITRLEQREKALNDENGTFTALVSSLNDDKAAARIAAACNDRYHDDLSCSTCSVREWAIEQYQMYLKGELTLEQIEASSKAARGPLEIQRRET